MSEINKVRGFIALPVLVAVLQGCDPVATSRESSGEIPSVSESQAFVQKIKNTLVYVEGGKFLMGDFGLEYAPERLPYDMQKHSRPLHEVELSSYSISRYKVTNAEFQFYLRSRKLSMRRDVMGGHRDWDDINSLPNTPAHADWYESKQYCEWLAHLTGEPFDLPTEAQWEYAARSRGQFLMVATDDGTYKAEPYIIESEDSDPKGINISSRGNRAEFGKRQGWKMDGVGPLPVDMFPPNPLGLYSMTDNGLEWTQDWYDPDYYSYSPLKDPQGPANAVFSKRHFEGSAKVMRGQTAADPYWGGGANVFRHPTNPHGRLMSSEKPLLSDKTLRCVVNSPKPINM